MRILILTVFFVSAFFYFSPNEGDGKATRTLAQDDSIKLKSAAPTRKEEKIIRPKRSTPVEGITTERPTEMAHNVVNESQDDAVQVEEVAWNELDRSWNHELKDFLGRLEPAESDSIHKSYLEEIESYKAEMEALLNEKQQKSSGEAVWEVDQLIGQLDQKHEDNLKEIFGAHYEAVADHYNEYMQSAVVLEE